MSNQEKKLSALVLGLVLMIIGGAAWVSITFSAPDAVRFVDDSTVGITGQVRVLCYQSAAGHPSADRLVNVVDGTPSVPLPSGCDFIAALRQIEAVDSGKPDRGPAYTLYHASFSPSDTTPLPASGDIVLSQNNKLTLFHVLASIAWEPAPGTTRLTAADLKNSLRSSSAYLYNLTEGQMAFGPVEVVTNGQKWSQADIRVLPANDRRPSAFVGGISENIRFYDGGPATTYYTPAEIYIGRGWDGALGAVDPDLGRWTNVITGSRTIGHEWSHYALFLYDEYQQTGGDANYCICQALPAGCGAGAVDGSAMAYHYTAQEYWHLFSHLAYYQKSVCESTWNWHFHTNTDWKVLDNWGAIQGKPVDAFDFPTTLSTQVPTLVDDFFDREPGEPAYLPVLARPGISPEPPPQEPEITILVDRDFDPSIWPFSEVFILKDDFQNPSQILPMGRARGGEPVDFSLGQLRLLGIEPDDRVRIIAQQFNEGAVMGFPTSTGEEETELGDGIELQTETQSWEYYLDHRFNVNNELIESVTFHLEATLSSEPAIQLCAVDPIIGCDANWEKTMELVAGTSGKWEASFSASEIGLTELPRFLVVRVRAPEVGLEGDIIQWVQVSGGVGPGHVDGIAPLVDGEVMLNTSNAVFGDPHCHISSYGPARHSQMAVDPLPPNFALVSLPMLVRIEMPFDTCPNITLGEDVDLNYNVIINLGYEQVDIDRIGVTETTANVQLLRYTPSSGWSTFQTVALNSQLNFVIGAINQDGIYAVGAVIP